MFRRVLAALAVLAFGLFTAPASPAVAAPPSSPLVQANSGTGNATAFTASLKKYPHAGNVIIIIIGLDAAAQVGWLEADDVEHVIDVAETWTAYQIPGAPYAVMFGAAANPAVKTWGFHGVAPAKTTWIAAELSGIRTFDPSGVPIWDGPAAGSAYDVGGTEVVINSGHRSDTAQPREVLFATYVARVTSGTPPTVTSFTNLYPQPGEWSRFRPDVVTSGAGANHRLDVAWKLATVTGSYDCLATWDAPPSGMVGMLTGLYAV